MKYQRIRDLREDHDLTQKIVAKVLCVSQRTYSYYETGGIRVPADIVYRLAIFYNTNANYILGLDNTWTPLRKS